MEALDFIDTCIIIKIFYAGEHSKKIPIPSSNLLRFFLFFSFLLRKYYNLLLLGQGHIVSELEIFINQKLLT